MSVMAAVAPMRAHAAVFSGRAQRPHRAVRAARPTVCKAVADPSATAKANKAEWNKLGQVCAVLGSQWGDEGKGKLVDILAQVRETRELVLMSLVRPARLSALAQHEWDAHDGVHAPPTSAVGVGRLLRRLDEALGVRSLDAAAPLVEAKMAHEIHRYWVAVLCGFSADGVGEDAAARLAGNDAYTLFQALGDLVISGPTLTNVNDFRAILIAPSA